MQNFSISKRKFIKYFLVGVFAVILGVSSGYRLLGAGRDFLGYWEVFESMDFRDSVGVVRFELGYMYFSRVSKFYFGLNFFQFVSLLVSFSVAIKLFVFSSLRNPIATIFFYLCCWYPVHDYIQLRLAVSLSLLLVAVNLLFANRLIGFIAFAALAVSFHYSVLIAVATFLVAYYLSSFSFLVVFVTSFGISIVLYLFVYLVYAFGSAFNFLVSAYVENAADFSINFFSGANILTVSLLSALLYAGSVEERKDRVLFIVALFALLFSVAFQDVPVFSHRIKEMLLFFLVPLAFNSTLTFRTVPQYISALALALWSLYSAVSDGYLGGG